MESQLGAAGVDVGEKVELTSEEISKVTDATNLEERNSETDSVAIASEQSKDLERISDKDGSGDIGKEDGSLVASDGEELKVADQEKETNMKK